MHSTPSSTAGTTWNKAETRSKSMGFPGGSGGEVTHLCCSQRLAGQCGVGQSLRTHQALCQRPRLLWGPDVELSSCLGTQLGLLPPQDPDKLNTHTETASPARHRAAQYLQCRCCWALRVNLPKGLRKWGQVPRGQKMGRARKEGGWEASQSKAANAGREASMLNEAPAGSRSPM